MRRVGFVLSHPLDQSLGSAARVREIVSSLDKLGVECHIFTPFGHTSKWGRRAVFHRFASLVSRTGVSDQAYSVFRRSIYRHKLANGILDERILHLLVRPLAHFLARALRKVDIDVLQAEQETAALATRIVAEDSGIPWVYDAHNVWFEELAGSGVIDRGGRRYHALKEMQESIIEDSDATVVVSHAMRHFLAETLRTPENRMVVVPPGGRRRIRRVPDRSGPPRLVHAGMVSDRQQVDLILEATSLILKKHPRARFYVTRRGDMLGDLKRRASALGAPIRFFWIPDEGRFFDFLAGCTVGLLVYSDDICRRLVMPAKLFDYMSVGLPMVANDNGTWTRLIEAEGVGILSRSDPWDLAEKTSNLLDDSAQQAEFAEKGLRLVDSKYSWDESGKTLNHVYDRLS